MAIDEKELELPVPEDVAPAPIADGMGPRSPFSRRAPGAQPPSSLGIMVFCLRRILLSLLRTQRSRIASQSERLSARRKSERRTESGVFERRATIPSDVRPEAQIRLVGSVLCWLFGSQQFWRARS